jgi:hypothetical protein
MSLRAGGDGEAIATSEKEIASVAVLLRNDIPYTYRLTTYYRWYFKGFKANRQETSVLFAG